MRHSANIGRLTLVLAFVLGIATSALHAGEIRQFKIDLPKKIISGQETTISIVGEDANDRTNKTDDRDLQVKIANGGQTTIDVISLSNGKASLKHTFAAPGATLVTVVDPSDPTLVDYKAFVVEYAPEVSK